MKYAFASGLLLSLLVGCRIASPSPLDPDAGTPDAGAPDAASLISDENCRKYGDEDGDGASDCADTTCQSKPECVHCGDGVVDPGELCDDANSVADDGCTNACKLPVCRDGVLQLGEACDAFDAQLHFLCTPWCTPNVCGDGVVLGAEACDDGNTIDDDGCSNACIIPFCGDGIVRPASPTTLAYEILATSPGGPAEVTLRWNGVAIATVSVTEAGACATPVTGNVGWDTLAGLVRTRDNVLSTEVAAGVSLSFARVVLTHDGRESTHTLVDAAPGVALDAACRTTLAGPLTLRATGFGFGFEECEGTAPGCQWCELPSCGDGIVQPERGEACDAGFAVDTTCTPACQIATCGDGFVRRGVEACDDGNALAGDGCTACTLDSCGDGVVDSYEACDDANAVSTDACVSCAAAYCGDGFVWQGFEACEGGWSSECDPNICQYLLH